MFKARRKTPEGAPVKANFPKPELKTVAPRAYRKAYKFAEAGGHGSSKGARSPEDLTTAITIAAPGGGFVGALGKRALEVGGKAVAKDVGEALAGKIESTAAKGSLKALRAGSAVKASGRLAGNLARRVAGREAVQAEKSAARLAAERAVARGEARTAQAAVPGLKLAKVSGGQMLPVVRGHEQALVHNPKKTLKTTARAIPGLVTYPVGVAIKGGTTVGRAASTAAHDVGVPGAAGYSGKEILAPVSHIPQEQLDFAKQVARVVTASDSKVVQKEVEDNLGLTLPIVLGLGSKAAADKLGKGRIVEAVRRVAERTRERHGKAHGYTGGRAPHVLEATRQHKESAKAVAQGRTRLRSELNDRQAGMLEAARHAAGSEVVRKGVARGKRGKTVDLKIHEADVASFLQRHPMPMNDPVKMLAEVHRIEKQLKPIPKGMEPPPGELYTRDVIAYIKRHPDVLAKPAVHQIVAEYRKQGRGARQTPGISPEHSERARFLSAATTRNIPFPEERFPQSVRSITRAEPTRGKLAKDVLRREARRDRSRARALKKKAAGAERRAAIMRRELATREKLNKGKLDLPPTKSQLRELHAIKAMERRGILPPELRPVGGHLHLVTPREGKAISSAKALPAAHEALRARVDKLDAKAVELREKATLAEQMAVAKHRASREVDTTLTPEFAEHVKTQLRKEGIPESQFPEYQHAGPGRQHGAPTYGSSGSKLTQFPGKSKRRKGTAEEYGLVAEGLRPMIRESIARPVARRESYKAARTVIENNRFAPGGKHEWNAREADELFQGPNPVLSSHQWMKVPRQFYKRIYDVLEGKSKGRAITEQDFKMVGELQALATGKGAKGSHYMIVRKPAMDELVAQLSNALVAPKIAKVNRATSYLILGTSPAWAAMQVIAEYGQAAVAQPKLLNPAFVRKAIRSYKAMDPVKRQAFDSWVGVTTRTIERAGDMKLDLKAGDVEAAAHAYSALEATPYGRFLRGIPTAIQRVDQWKGGRIRALVALSKIDKELNGKTNRFLLGIGGLHREMGKALEQMKGKDLTAQTEWVAEHPKWAHRYQAYLDDVMGNWSALTKNERVAAQAMIFYPFIRMSLRWTFYAFPKRHPIKAAMLYWLGQQNAQEIHKLLHGDPSYFTQWAMVPIDLGGEKKFLDLSRIAPGSNALVEALGGDTQGPKGAAVARVAQPALAALGTAIYGVSPLSGKQEKGSGWNALAQLLSLSPISRVAGEATVPAGRKRGEGLGRLPVVGSLSTERQAALDKLSAKLRGYNTAERYLRSLAVPPYPKDVGKERDAALLGRVLKALGGNSSSHRDSVSADYAQKIVDAVEEGHRSAVPALKAQRDKQLALMKRTEDEAQKALDNLFKRHGIPFQKENRLFLQAYSEGKYGTKKSSNPWSGGGASSSSGNPWSAAVGGGHNPWSGK